MTVENGGNEAGMPLKGVRVLDLTRLLPGGYATLILASMGADVVKVEDKKAGDYTRLFGKQVEGQGSFHHMLNRGKKSVTLDLKDPQDRLRFEDLVKTSDLLMESFRPGVLEALGYGLTALHALAPHLVVCSISGFGQTGPMREDPAHDLNLLAWSGLLDRQRGADGKPVMPPVAWADVLVGTNAALYSIPYLSMPRSNRKGVHIDLAMAEAVALLPTRILADILVGAAVPKGPDYVFADGNPAYGVYRAKDGFVSVAAVEDHFARNLYSLAGLDYEMSKDRTAEGRRAAIARFSDFFAQRSVAELLEADRQAHACIAEVLSVEDMLGTDQALSRGFVASEGIPSAGLPVLVNGQRLRAAGSAPRQGEHNTEFFDTDA